MQSDVMYTVKTDSKEMLEVVKAFWSNDVIICHQMDLKVQSLQF